MCPPIGRLVAKSERLHRKPRQGADSDLCPTQERQAKAEGISPQFDTEIICRLIKVKLENGAKEILCTSLTDDSTYLYSDFEKLYHYRWNEEEAYKLLKSRIELEDFSGKTAKAVKQDFYAKVFLMTLSAAYAHPVEERVIAEYEADKNRKHGQKINRTNALATTMDILVPAFIGKKYKEAEKILPTNSLLCHIGDLYFRIGKYNKAKDAYWKAYYMIPHHAKPIYELTQVLLMEKRYEEASQIIDTYLNLPRKKGTISTYRYVVKLEEIKSTLN